VPRRGASQTDVPDHVADNGQLSLAPEIVMRRTVVRAGKRDSVASIARRYRLNAAQVADWNNVAPSASFRPGQQVVLQLPVRQAVRTAVRVPAKGVKQVSSRAAPAKPAPRRTAAPVKKRR
jgi:membrane-bound lytic murein transglycosylase D